MWDALGTEDPDRVRPYIGGASTKFGGCHHTRVCMAARAPYLPSNTIKRREPHTIISRLAQSTPRARGVLEVFEWLRRKRVLGMVRAESCVRKKRRAKLIKECESSPLSERYLYRLTKIHGARNPVFPAFLECARYRRSHLAAADIIKITADTAHLATQK